MFFFSLRTVKRLTKMVGGNALSARYKMLLDITESSGFASFGSSFSSATFPYDKFHVRFVCFIYMFAMKSRIIAF